VAKNISDHQADESKYKILRAGPREARGHHWAGRQFWLLGSWDEAGIWRQHTLKRRAA
jgi:hypothetical protein